MRATAKPKSKTHVRTVRGRIRKGKIVPIAALGLPEGEEVLVTIRRVPGSKAADEFSKLAGAWKGKVDAEKWIRQIYRDRIRGSRPMNRI